MPIDTPHPSYSNFETQWQRIRNTYDGSDAVKKQGTLYLPKLSGQSQPEYDSYKMRAVYFNGIERTVSGLVGAVMRIEPIFKVSDKLRELFTDITDSGVSINNLISIMLKEQILTARQGLLVDYKNRPYLVHYSTEQMINWFENTIVLKETYKPENTDIYKIEFRDQYRELTLSNNEYMGKIWRKSQDGTTWISSELARAESKDRALDFIPFIGISNDGFNLEPSKSDVLALSDMALSLYRTSADLEHGRHYTALPTPWISSANNQTEATLNIGPSKVWLLPENSNAGYLEFSGQGLKALEVGMDEKRSMMASLGSQLLQGQKAGVESADAVRLRQNAEASTLINSVKMVEKAITKALVIMNDWEGLAGSDDISVKLNTDFVDAKMSPQEITAMMGAWQAGGISHDSLLYNFKRGERLEPNVDIQTEKEKIRIEIENEDLMK